MNRDVSWSVASCRLSPARRIARMLATGAMLVALAHGIPELMAASPPGPHVLADVDGDGLDDAWEIAYFGSITTTDGRTDMDGDGMTEWQEFIAGTDPTNPASVLVLTDAQHAAGVGNKIAWQSATGLQYEVEWSADLLGPFRTVAAGVAATPPENGFVDVARGTNSPGFYRVSAASGTNRVPSRNVAGLLSAPVPPAGGYVLATYPLRPFGGAPATLLSVLGTNGLRSSNLPAQADRVYIWDVGAQTYRIYGLRASDLQYHEMANWAGSPTNPPLPLAFWLQSSSSEVAANTIWLAGEVPDEPTRQVDVAVGWNFLAYPYPATAAITNMGLDAVARHDDYPNSDEIRTGTSTNGADPSAMENSYWLPIGDTWLKYPESTPTADALPVGAGFAFLARTNFLWTAARPYSMTWGVVGPSTTSPLVTATAARLVDFFPRMTNGENGVFLTARDGGGAYRLLTYFGDYSFKTVGRSWNIPILEVADFPSGKIMAIPSAVNQVGVKDDPAIRIQVGSDYPSVRIWGSAGLNSGSGSARFYVYQGDANYVTPLWQGTDGGAFDLTVPSAGGDLYLAVDAGANDMNDWPYWLDIRLQGVAPSPPAAGLVSRWTSDGTASDASTNRNDGLPQNGATYGTGKFGQAFAFDGVDSFVQINDAPSLRPRNLTVECWFSANDGTGMLVSKPLGSSLNNSFALWLQNGDLNGSLGNATFAGPLLSHPFSPATGVWCHVAYTFDDDTDTDTLYLNGLPVATANVNFSIDYDAHPLLIGIENDAGSFVLPWNGLIDEVRIYDRALTADEVWRSAGGKSPLVDNNGGATNVTANGAILTGNLVSDGGLPTVVRVYYGAADGGTVEGTWGNSVECGVSGVGPFATNTYNLTPKAG